MREALTSFMVNFQARIWRGEGIVIADAVLGLDVLHHDLQTGSHRRCSVGASAEQSSGGLHRQNLYIVRNIRESFRQYAPVTSVHIEPGKRMLRSLPKKLTTEFVMSRAQGAEFDSFMLTLHWTVPSLSDQQTQHSLLHRST